MIATTPGFLADLERAATQAQQSEIAFRDSIAAEIARRERERQFAFRRLGVAREMAAAAAGAKDEAEAIAAQTVALRRELGWHGESAQRRKALDAWRLVATAVWQDLHAQQTPDASAPSQTAPSVQDALQAFEAWYVTEFGSSYLALMDHEMPEMPVVEF